MIENPTTLRPHVPIVASLTRPTGQRSLSNAPHALRRTVHRRAPAPVAVLALHGVTVDGDILDLPIPVGLYLTDPLPVPDEALADLEVDLDDHTTITVPIDDPDAAAAVGAVILDGVADLPMDAWIAVATAD